MNEANHAFYKEAMPAFEQEGRKAYREYIINSNRHRRYTSDSDEEREPESEIDFLDDFISSRIERTQWNNFVTADNLTLIFDHAQSANDISIALNAYITKPEQSLTEEVFEQIVNQCVQSQEKIKPTF